MFRIDRRLVNLEPRQRQQAIKTDDKPIVNQAEEVQAATAKAKQQLEDELKKEQQRVREQSKRAEEAMRQAKLTAQTMTQEAEIEALNMRTQGYEAGYREGREEAESELRQQLEEDRSALRRVIEEVMQARQSLLDGLEPEIVALTLSLARKIVGAAIETDDTVYQSLLKNALRQMKREGRITIRVNPAEKERFFPSGSATFTLGDESVTAAILSDPALPAGGCIAESDGETINAGVDSQLRYLTIAFDEH